MFKHLSYSHLHLLACPYAAFLRYQAAVKGPTTKWIALGNAVHLALEKGHNSDGLFAGFDVAHANDVFREEFARIIEDESVAIGWPEMKKMEAEGIDMVRIYDEQIDKGIISSAPLALEKSFTIPFLDTAIVGRIDKVEHTEDGYIITDFKTGKTAPTKWSLSHNVQLSTYAWACLLEYGELPYKLVWYHARTGALMETTRTMQDIEDVKNMVGNAIAMNDAGIRTRIFHDNVCNMCDYQGPTCDDRDLEKEALAALEIGERLEARVVIKPAKWNI